LFWDGDIETFSDNVPLFQAIHALALKLTKFILFNSKNTQILHEILEITKRLTSVFVHFNTLEFFERLIIVKDTPIRYILENRTIMLIHRSMRKILKRYSQSAIKMKLDRDVYKTKLDVHGGRFTKFKHSFNKDIDEFNIYYVKLKGSDKLNSQLLPDHKTEYLNKVIGGINDLLDLQKLFLDFRFKFHFENYGFRFDDYYHAVEIDKLINSIQHDSCISFENFVKYFDQNNCPAFKAVIEKPCYSLGDLWLVIIHGGLALVNIFAISHTLGIYHASLDIGTGFGVVISVIVACVSFTGFLILNAASVNQYKAPYLASIVIFFVGNLLFYLAETVKSNKSAGWGLYITGRCLIATGTGKILTLKFLTLSVETQFYIVYITYYVIDIAIGMCWGSGLYSMLSFISEYSKIGSTAVTPFNAASFVFLFVWILYFFIMAFFFKGKNPRIKQYYVRMKLIEPRSRKRNELLLRMQSADIDFITRNEERLTNEPKKEYIVEYSDPKTKEVYDKLNEVSNELQPFENKAFPILFAFFPNVLTSFIILIFFIQKTIQTALIGELLLVSSAYYDYDYRWVGWFMLISFVYCNLTSSSGAFLLSVPPKIGLGSANCSPCWGYHNYHWRHHID
jgi:hypothetical protein